MRKIIIFGTIGVILCYFTIISIGKAFRSDWQLPSASDGDQAQYRLVLITQELDTPFWEKVGKGALQQAEAEGANLKIWGSYGNNQEDFLRQVEIAIQSKVDGIIVQGLDTDIFKELTKIKAAFYGIPVITVANDVPMEESLRRTYVGSDQVLAGEMIARQLLSDMGEEGTVILMGDSHQKYYQEQRIDGIYQVLKDYPNVQAVYVDTPTTREEVFQATRDLLNRMPEADAFIAVNANIAGAMIQEIRSRSQVAPYYIYTFDDGTESITLYEQGVLDGMIEQSPEQMGRMSVEKIVRWLQREEVPLDADGYFTDIRMLKAMDAHE
ncbi:sugar ABC transporter substrate-binding protein [Marinicrinis lubricantis]|uniref:Sugar ABC transporter substrate-binding protein n=1 Tax=Marinicrinis lubricantis TaxID=2086470 RepID=A0ABW1IPT3_9BACL